MPIGTSKAESLSSIPVMRGFLKIVKPERSRYSNLCKLKVINKYVNLRTPVHCGRRRVPSAVTFNCSGSGSAVTVVCLVCTTIRV